MYVSWLHRQHFHQLMPGLYCAVLLVFVSKWGKGFLRVLMEMDGSWVSDRMTRRRVEGEEGKGGE